MSQVVEEILTHAGPQLAVSQCSQGKPVGPGNPLSSLFPRSQVISAKAQS